MWVRSEVKVGETEGRMTEATPRPSSEIQQTAWHGPQHTPATTFSPAGLGHFFSAFGRKKIGLGKFFSAFGRKKSHKSHKSHIYHTSMKASLLHLPLCRCSTLLSTQ